MKAKKIIKFIIYVFGPLIIGSIVGISIGSESYKIVAKPVLSPPGIVFPIAWSILYILMGISFYIVSKNELDNKTIAIYLTGLAINYIWPFLFFKLNYYYLSAVWIVILIYFVINMIVRFYNIKKIAGLLQLPYLLWLLFALYLNVGVALLN